MAIYDVKVNQLDGTPASLGDYKGKALLIVNVASQVRPHPPVRGPREAARDLGAAGFEVLGFPCNQFLEQEPGTADEIQEFCTVNYGVQFPLFEKIEVNGDHQHPLYKQLNAVADGEGYTGDIRWNFEKFLVSARRRGRRPLQPDRRRPRTRRWSSAIEAQLPSWLRASGCGRPGAESRAAEVGNRRAGSSVPPIA